MKVVEVLVKTIPFKDGSPSITCWVKTDGPYVDGETEFACGCPFPAEGQSPSEAAATLRWMADCVDSMSFRPRPNLTIVK